MKYCDEYYCDPTQEEIDEMESACSTEVDFDFKNLVINFDVENFAKGIAREVKRTLKREVISELRKEVLENIEEDILENISTISEGIVREVYENEKITVGAWGKETREVPVKEYLLEEMQKSFERGKFLIKKRSPYGGYEPTEVGIREYIDDKIDFSVIQKGIDKEIDSIRKDINARIKDMFDSSTRQMLSDNILQVLMANETYQKIQSNVACIADRKEGRKEDENEDYIESVTSD